MRHWLERDNKHTGIGREIVGQVVFREQCDGYYAARLSLAASLDLLCDAIQWLRDQEAAGLVK